jgi:hypothetical protein
MDDEVRRFAAARNCVRGGQQLGEVSVTKVEKVNELVQMVRTLNWEVRPKIGSTPGGDPSGNPVHQALGELRDQEIVASQTIRGMSLSETAAQMAVLQEATHEPVDKVGSRQLLSEFGTARESILSLLRTISDEDWAQTHETPNGAKSMESVVDELIRTDRGLIERITGGTT